MPQVGVRKRVIAVDVSHDPIVVVKGLNRQGRPITVEGEGLLARVLQHEMDHVDGILFIARTRDPMRLWRVSELSTATEKAVTHI